MLNILSLSRHLPSISPGPCPPRNVSVSTECGASTVSWSPVSGAESYIATATAHDGHNYTCSSSSANSCSFTDLHCGENYSVSVVAVDRGCHSEPSVSVELKTGEKKLNKETCNSAFDLIHSFWLRVDLFRIYVLESRHGWMCELSEGRKEEYVRHPTT